MGELNLRGLRHVRPKTVGEQTQKYEEVGHVEGTYSLRVRISDYNMTWWMDKGDVRLKAERALGCFR